MSSLIRTVLVTVGNMALSVWDFLLSDTAFFCFPPSSWSVISALVIPTTWIKMKHSLQKLMSLLEITGYISSKGRGKSIRWSEPILDICSARSELSTNFDLKKHQIPQRVQGSSSRLIVATWLKPQIHCFLPCTRKAWNWRQQQTKITFLELLLLCFLSCPGLLIDLGYSPPAHSWCLFSWQTCFQLWDICCVEHESSEKISAIWIRLGKRGRTWRKWLCIHVSWDCVSAWWELEFNQVWGLWEN